ncbi:MAG: phosphate acetyltransferase [Buchnera aphidicola (Nurudea shiraii)]
MKRVLMLIPIGFNVGLTTTSIGLIQKIQQSNLKVKFFKPIFSNLNFKGYIDHTTKILRNMSSVACLNPIKVRNLNDFLTQESRQNILKNVLLEIDSDKRKYDVLILEGICLRYSILLSSIINYEVAQSTNAEIIFMSTVRKDNIVDINNIMNIIKEYFLKKKCISVKGIIINEFATLQFDFFGNFINYFNMFNTIVKKNKNNSIDYNIFCKNYGVSLLGYIPWHSKLIEKSLDDISRYFKVYPINKCNLSNISVRSITIYHKNDILKNSRNVLSHAILIISPDHLHDLHGISEYVDQSNDISALFFTNSYEIDVDAIKLHFNIKKMCVPIFFMKCNLLKMIDLFRKISFKMSCKNFKKFKLIQNYVSKYIRHDLVTFIKAQCVYKYQKSPALFIYNLQNLARRNKKTILLPEGNELRIIKAASICSDQNIANCILLGNSKEIITIAKLNNINLKSDIEILNPELIRYKYVERYLELRRKHKITTLQARKDLKNNSILSTLILESNQVDGLVSGSVNTTSDTILPALQLIKTSQYASLISSVFFMLLPDHVLLYADCAINPNPNADQLAEIAIQSANTAILFGICPKIAMLSYATGWSSNSKKVEKVRKATDIVKKMCPNLIVEGPIQYDAAIDSIVSKLKCFNSVIKGTATIFIFPDLNSGNIAYKAVQRSTNIISIGPILQGIKKPVNDLSRGASVQDIVYTIAVTSIQAE